MTTYARKIAEAVRDAAASACERTQQRYVKEDWKLEEIGARVCKKSVQGLDLDAIIAGVPEPQAAEPKGVTDEQIVSVQYAAEWLSRSEDIHNQKHAERLRALLAKGE